MPGVYLTGTVLQVTKDSDCALLKRVKRLGMRYEIVDNAPAHGKLIIPSKEVV